MQAAIAEAEPFNVLVNNAGTNRPKLLLDVTVEDFDAIMGLNVRAAYFVAQAVARRLIAAEQPGSIINISSQMGHVGRGAAHGLLRVEARHGGLHEGDGRRARPARHPRQHAGADVPGDAADASPSSTTRRSRPRCWPRSSSAGSARSRTCWARIAVPRLRRLRPGDRHLARRRRRLDRRLRPPAPRATHSPPCPRADVSC